VSNIVEFLRARYTERRALALAATSGPWRAEPFVYGLPEEGWGEPSHWEIKADSGEVVGHQPHEGGGVYGEADARHIAAHGPDVALADLDAKLGIIDWYEVASSSPELARDAWQIMRQVLLLLAVPFAAHPDYDERWRP
jgi:hypothetical protein